MMDDHIIDTCWFLSMHRSTVRLVVDKMLIKKDPDPVPDSEYSLFYQITRITKDRDALSCDDHLDALAGAAAYWKEQMEKAVQAHKKRLLDSELEKFARSVLGCPPMADI